MSCNEPQQVFLVWHTHELNDGQSDEKLLGVYSTEERAKSRIGLAVNLPGFSEAPDGFEVAHYVVDRDQWPEGFVSS